MAGFYTEADYENSVIELFQSMGYRYVYAPDLERDFKSPLYEEELYEALHRLNPTMPEDAIADALYKLKNFENAELVQKNALFMDYLQHGVEVRYFIKGEERSGSPACTRPTTVHSCERVMIPSAMPKTVL